MGHAFVVGSLIAGLLVYVWSALRVAGARAKYKVDAPAVVGHPAFERAFRAQANTVEQMILFVPLLLLAALFWGDVWVGAYGGVWCLGRLLYIETYIRDPATRSAGFVLSGGVSMIVLAVLAVAFVARLAGLG